jgi:hypothetical protein
MIPLNEQEKSIIQSILDEVHELWEQNSNIYTSGYAVFYSYVYKNPALMLVGDNPGGEASDFSGRETLSGPEEIMEYIRFKDDKEYKLASKTYKLFESIGHLNLLNSSVKSNRNFFRSKNLSTLNQNDQEFCKERLLRIINIISPTVILCESLGAYDLIMSLYNTNNEYKEQIICKSIGKKLPNKGLSDKGLFNSSASDTAIPQIIIGYPHLSSGNNHLSTEEVAVIQNLLKIQLDKTFIG